MARLSGVFSVASPLTPLPALAHPLQVLVIDRLNGPADVLFDAVRLLAEAVVEVTLVEDHDDALRALDICSFDLLVVGLDVQRPMQMALLPHLRGRAPHVPVIVIGRAVSAETLGRARRFGALDALELPQRAAELRALIARLWQEYLLAA